MLHQLFSGRPGLSLRLAVAAGIAVFSLSAAAEDGWYSDEQAEEGQTTYNSFCATCHGPDLEGAQGPALKGEKFLSKWETGKELYDYSANKMPPINPGTVPEEDMVKIMAFLFSENDLPSGDALESSDDVDRALKPE